MKKRTMKTTHIDSRRPVGRQLARDGGFSLMELLVATFLTLIVLANDAGRPQ